MSTSVRVGSLQVPPLQTIINDGTNDGRCEMGGIISWLANILFDRYKVLKYNCTLIGFNELGTFNKTSKQYSGMIGSLFRGDIDAAGCPVYYPLHDDDDILDTSNIFAEDTMQMGSVYNVSRNKKTVDILQMYSTIPSSVWICCIVSFFMLMMALHTVVKSLKLKSRSDAPWLTLCAFLDQDNFPTKTTSLTILSVFSTTSLFFITSYITNSASTNLVVVEEPVIIKDYQDFIDGANLDPNNWMSGFSAQIADYETFRDADVGTKEREIYKFAKFFDQSNKRYDKFFKQIIEQKGALFGRELFIEAVSYGILGVMSFNNPDGRVLRSFEEEPKKFTNVFVARRQTDQVLYNEYHKVFTRLFVSGITLKTYKEVALHILQDKLQTEFSPTFKRKLTDSVEEIHPEMTNVKITNVKLLLLLYFGLIVVSLTALVNELKRH